jgi:hypothetical protein
MINSKVVGFGFRFYVCAGINFLRVMGYTEGRQMFHWFHLI